MELKDTAALMTSADYKERFKAEVWQLRMRLLGLQRITNDMQYRELSSRFGKMIDFTLNGTIKSEPLDFTPDCPRSLLELQVRAMTDYLAVLEARAKIEGVEL